MKSLSYLKRASTHPSFFPLLLVALLTWLAVKPLFGSGYFNMHDDLQMMRQLEMEKCFLDGQIPCRWIPDMGYGFGYPLFNFYPPLPYLVGEVFRLVGYSYVDTAKALFIVSFFASAAAMYLLSKRFFGRMGGVLSAVFYVWAPYHAVDSYVRGAMNESWALIWFPLILLFSYNILSLKTKRSKEYLSSVLLLAFSWFALFTSHNLMVIVFSPFFAVWCGVWVLYYKNWKAIIPLVIAGLFSFGLAAFFTLPVLLEKNVVQTNTLIQGYYEYTAHFPSAAQLFFSRFWGYGPSVWMTADDKMSFQIGWLHWGGALVAGVLLVIRTAKTRKLDPLFWSIVLMALTASGAAFMAHPRSTPIWQHLQAFQFIQFPWRYLTMAILGTSFVVGAFAALIKSFPRYLIVLLLSIGVIAYSWNYFVPEHGHLGPLTDQEKFTGATWQLQQTAGIYDYLPNTAKTAPKGPRTVIAEGMEGDAIISNGENGTNWLSFDVKATEGSIIRINQLDFPHWDISLDGIKTDSFIPDTEEWGRFYIKVPAGEHKVYAKLHDTLPRTAGNILSVVSWVIFVMLVVKEYRRRYAMQLSQKV